MSGCVPLFFSYAVYCYGQFFLVYYLPIRLEKIAVFLKSFFEMKYFSFSLEILLVK